MPYTDILNAMKNGATVVTPNNRLSEALIKQYFKNEAHTSLKKPNCLAYPQFLKQTFQHLRTHSTDIHHPIILTPAQLNLLWQSIITPKINHTLDLNFIHAIQQAFVICKNWHIEFPNPHFQTTPETAQFEHYCLDLKTRLSALHAITEAELAHYLTEHQLTGHHAIVWVCFDEYTPAQKTLQAHFTSLNLSQTHIDLPEKDHAIYQAMATDKQDEYRHITHLIKSSLAEEKNQIAIIVPDLNQEAPALKRHLARHFAPHEFNISLGEPLLNYPLVAHAFQWLKLNLYEIHAHQIALLLDSPYLASADTEHIQRAECKQSIPLLEERTLRFTHFKHSVKEKAPALFDILNKLTPYPKKATPREWAALFTARLNQLGFPGEKGLSSLQYQCFERLKGLFDEFIALHVIEEVLDKKTALSAFQDLAKTCIFQPQKNDAPINILGLLEASGCIFDAAWVCGVTDQNLPSKTRFNAFIPIALQREVHMPYTDAAREHLLAEKRLSRLKHSSKTLILSYPAQLDDTPCMPSPLMESLPLLQIMPPKETSQVALQSEEETYHVPFNPLDKIKGGSARLTNQALCPFRAFAAHRLHATDLPLLKDGPDASLRGQVLHAILENLWRTLKSQQNLKAIGSEVLNTEIDHAITKALRLVKKHKPSSFTELISSVEHKRLKRLVDASLDWDKARPSFEVTALEESFELTLGALQFHIRLDRLDTLSSGEKWLIDYKSRMPSPLPFDEERPEAPQLLLYALLDNTIRGLLFLELKQGDINCRGLAASPDDLKGIKAPTKDTTWEAYQAAWHKRLNLLANEFFEGYCPPQPKKSSTCMTCSFDALCRI